jgi:ferredoxin
MEVMQIKKKALYDFVESLIKKGREVDGVVRRENRFAFDTLSSSKDLILDFDETILPPKKYFLPVKEPLLSFTSGDPASCEAFRDDRGRVIIGMHPADCAAVALLDATMKETNCDPQYKTRRDNTVIVGLYPTKEYAYRFTTPQITQVAYKTADLMLVDLKDGSLAVEVVTAKGKNLLAKARAIKATEPVIKKMEKAKTRVKVKVVLNKPPASIPQFLNGREKDPVFEKRAKRCFSCGSCVMVCPTCYCFDVTDDVDLSLKKGVRARTWDGCMLQGFAQVAGGHNFRKKPEDRLRHRIFRKTKYLFEKFGLPGCVGCGRCGHACVAVIASPAEVLNEMA